MWMHAVGPGGVVPKYDVQSVANLGVQDRPKNSEILRFGTAGLELRKSCVGVLAVNRLPVHLPDAVCAPLHESCSIAIEFHAHHFVDAIGSVVPIDFVGSNIVSADFAWRIRLRPTDRTGHGRPHDT